MVFFLRLFFWRVLFLTCLFYLIVFENIGLFNYILRLRKLVCSSNFLLKIILFGGIYLILFLSNWITSYNWFHIERSLSQLFRWRIIGRNLVLFRQNLFLFFGINFFFIFVKVFYSSFCDTLFNLFIFIWWRFRYFTSHFWMVILLKWDILWN